MAGGQERILRGRIRSVQATKKITRAMELIAASRIVKAQQRVQAAVPYSDKITEVVRDLAAAGAGTDLPLLAGREEVRRTCYVAVTADRGLAGGYNAGVQRATEGEVKAGVAKGQNYVIVPVGRKAQTYFRFRGYHLGEAFNGFSDNPHYADAKAIGDHVIELFESGEVDRVELIYTRFISAGSQEVVQRPLVPLVSMTGGDVRRPGTGPDVPARRLRVRAGPDHDPRRPAAALRRGPGIRRAAQRRRVGARLPPAGDEIGDRQRRGADQDAEPDHEPRPAGRDHDRDHGDRRRRRGAVGREGRRQGAHRPGLRHGVRRTPARTIVTTTGDTS